MSSSGNSSAVAPPLYGNGLEQSESISGLLHFSANTGHYSLSNEPQAKKKKGCLRTGCGLIGWLLLALILVAGWAYVINSDIPERLGLRKPPAERLLSGEPDRASADAILSALNEGGLSTQGVRLYVLPVEGTNYQIAYAVLEASEGFTFDYSGGDDAMTGLLVQMATSEEVTDARIERVAIDYRNASGDQVAVITAPVSILRAYAEGRASAEEVSNALDVGFNAAEMYEWYREALQ